MPWELFRVLIVSPASLDVPVAVVGCRQQRAEKRVCSSPPGVFRPWRVRTWVLQRVQRRWWCCERSLQRDGSGGVGSVVVEDTSNRRVDDRDGRC